MLHCCCAGTTAAVEPEPGLESADEADSQLDALPPGSWILRHSAGHLALSIRHRDTVYHHEQMTTVQTDMPAAVGAQRRELWDSAVADLLQEVS